MMQISNIRKTEDGRQHLDTHLLVPHKSTRCDSKLVNAVMRQCDNLEMRE